MTKIEVISKLGKRIRVTESYWNFIVTVKHTYMRGKENEVKETLKDPDEIKRSTKDPTVYLYYKRQGNIFVCVVCKHLNDEGYVVTTYLTDKMKIGEVVWKR